jgi:hypothetical protein
MKQLPLTGALSVVKGPSLDGLRQHQRCCAVRAFNESGCKVIFPVSAGAWICLSGTRYQANHKYVDKLCDLLLGWDRAAGGLVCAALELKGGGIDVTGVVKQLQNGADIIDSLFAGERPAFLPVIVHRTMSAVQLRELRKRKINFRGRRRSITLMNCGGRILDLTW